MLEQYKKKGTVCMEYNSMNQWGEIQASQRESLSAYTAKTFLWMFAGLLVTFAMTYASSVSYTHLTLPTTSRV